MVLSRVSPAPAPNQNRNQIGMSHRENPSPSTGSDIIPKNEPNSGRYEKDNPNRRELNKYTPIEKLTLGLLIFTILYAITAVIQVYLDNLPYVSIDPTRTTLTWPTNGKPVEIIVGLRVIGKGPAYSVSLQRAIGLSDRGEKLPWHKFDYLRPVTGADLIPGAVYEIPIYSDFDADDEMISRITKEEKFLISLIQIYWKDWLGIEHTNRICEKAIPKERRMGLCADPTLRGLKIAPRLSFTGPHRRVVLNETALAKQEGSTQDNL